jgi:hypothetical protein
MVTQHHAYHTIISLLQTMKLLTLLLVSSFATAFVSHSYANVIRDKQSKCRHRCTEIQAVPPGVDLALISSSVALLSGYHIRLSLEEKKIQEQGGCVTWRQYQADAREQWARHVK